MCIRDSGYTVINSSQNVQKGLTCGYICANISSKFYTHIHSENSQWIYADIIDCASPDISLFNQMLGINGIAAEELTAEQIMKLVCTITGDQNIGWIFTVDINLFKKMAMNEFRNIKLPSLNGSRWAIFCINDAVLSDDERERSIQRDEFNGSHWFTTAIWL